MYFSFSLQIMDPQTIIANKMLITRTAVFFVFVHEISVVFSITPFDWDALCIWIYPVLEWIVT